MRGGRGDDKRESLLQKALKRTPNELKALVISEKTVKPRTLQNFALSGFRYKGYDGYNYLNVILEGRRQFQYKLTSLTEYVEVYFRRSDAWHKSYRTVQRGFNKPQLTGKVIRVGNKQYRVTEKL